MYVADPDPEPRRTETPDPDPDPPGITPEPRPIPRSLEPSIPIPRRGGVGIDPDQTPHAVIDQTQKTLLSLYCRSPRPQTPNPKPRLTYGEILLQIIRF